MRKMNFVKTLGKLFFSHLLSVYSHAQGCNTAEISRIIKSNIHTLYGVESASCDYVYIIGDVINLKLTGGSKIQRSEIVIDPLNQNNSIVEYGFKVRFDGIVGINFSDDWWIFSQFHDQPNREKGENWESYKKSPPSFATYIRAYGDYGDICLSGKSIPMGVGCRRVSFDREIDLKFIVKWSFSSDGFVFLIICDNFCTTLHFFGKNMINDYRHYFKIGQYVGGGEDIFGVLSFRDIYINEYRIKP